MNNPKSHACAICNYESPEGYNKPHNCSTYLYESLTKANKRLSDLYDVIGKAIENPNISINETRLHDYLGNQEGVTAESIIENENLHDSNYLGNLSIDISIDAQSGFIKFSSEGLILNNNQRLETGEMQGDALKFLIIKFLTNGKIFDEKVQK